MGIGTLRFVLSLLVIDAHYGFLGSRLQTVVVNRFGIDHLAYIGSGGIAVSGFFVVSGYLITLVLSRKYESGWRGAQAFYVSRALRIYPLYWLAFALYWWALARLQTPPALDPFRLAGNLTLIPYGAIGMITDRNESGIANLTETMLIGPSWTLCYDLLFYLLAPWLFVRKSSTWWIVGLGCAYFAAFIAFADGRPPIWYQFFYETGTPYLLMFACGALAYHYRKSLAYRPGTTIALIAGLAWLTYFPLGFPNTFVNHLLVVLLFTPLVAMLGQRRHAPRVDRVLGDLTYATYLLHLPLLILVQRMGWPAAPLWALALTYAASLFLLWTFELPLDRLRDSLYERFRERNPPQREPRTHAVPMILTATLALAAGLSLWSNLWKAGDAVALRSDGCPAGWRCEGGHVAFEGHGKLVLAPALGKANRIVADLDLTTGPGAAWAGFTSLDGVVRAGIRRDGERCLLDVADANGTRTVPTGWSSECRPHRLAFDFATGDLRVVVDSLWIMTAGPAPDALHAAVHAEAGSRGEARFANVFMTRR